MITREMVMVFLAAVYLFTAVGTMVVYWKSGPVRRIVAALLWPVLLVVMTAGIVFLKLAKEG